MQAGLAYVLVLPGAAFWSLHQGLGGPHRDVHLLNALCVNRDRALTVRDGDTYPDHKKHKAASRAVCEQGWLGGWRQPNGELLLLS